MISSLRLQNFRSYTNRLFEFDSKTNIIVGPNAIGKTNILEAILVSRMGKSYRAKDVDLIMFNKPWARIDSVDNSLNRIIKITRDQTPGKTFDINDKKYIRLPASLKLPVVVFEPNHLQLLNGSPDGRRNYLDDFIEQINEEYGPILRKYSRALAQRNKLLKNLSRPTTNQIFPWNIRISQLAGQIVKYRVDLISKINKVLPGIYSSLALDKVKIATIYKSQLPIENYESAYLKKLDLSLDEDLRAGFTLIGPHRDDFSITYNGHSSGSYASRGELRTAILALKVTELETIKGLKDVNPIILLDDVYSELDSTRRQALTSYLTNQQSFITTTDADLVASQLVKKSNVIKL